jgi:hypothetical protein
MTALIQGSGHMAKWTAIVSLSALFCWFGLMAQAPVKGGPMRVVRLELAPTVRAADRFMRAWKDARPNWKCELNDAQGWDTWFICAYAPLFTLLCWVAAAHLSLHFPKLGAVGYALAGTQLLAGTLDFVENAAMQTTIDAGHAAAPWPTIGASASGIKWLLILCFAIYAGGALIHWGIAVADRSSR